MLIWNFGTAVFCFVVCLQAARRMHDNLLKTLVFFGFGVIHGVAPALTSPDSFGTPFSLEARNVASVFAFFAAVALASGWSLGVWLRRPDGPQATDLIGAIRRPEAARLLKRLFWVSALLGLLGMVVMWRATGVSLSEFVDASRFAYRESRNPLLYLLGVFLISFAFMPGFLSFFIDRSYRVLAVVYVTISVLLLFFVVEKGARAMPVGLLGSLAVGYLLQRQFDVRKLAWFVLASASLFYLTVGLYAARQHLHESYETVLWEVLQPGSLQDLLVQDPLNYNEYLVGAVDTFPERHPYLAMATYRRMLFFFLRHSSYPELKPEDANKVFAVEAFGTPPSLNVTIPPSVPGDVYINFWGWPGLVVLVIYGVFGAFVDHRLVTDPLWFVVFVPQLVRLVCLGLRGQPYDLFVLCSATLFAGYLVVQATGCRLAWVREESSRQCRERTASTGNVDRTPLPHAKLSPRKLRRNRRWSSTGGMVNEF